MLQQSASGGQSVRSAGTYGAKAVVGFNHVAIARKQKRSFHVGNDQQGLEMAQRAIRAPFFCQLDGRASQIAVELLQLIFEAREKRERVASAAGKSGDNFVVEEPTRLFRVVLHYSFAHGDLA